MRRTRSISGWLLLAAAAGGAGCAPERAGTPAGLAPSSAGERVLVIENLADPASRRLAAFYVRARGLAPAQLAVIATDAEEEVAFETYLREIEAPVRRHLERTGLRESVDFLVTTKGIPLRVRETGSAVDALLGAMDLGTSIPSRDAPQSLIEAANPYFGADRPFSRREFGFYLTARIDGYNVHDARSLVRRALSAHPAAGPFLLDLDPLREGYGEVNQGMRRAAAILAARGHEVAIDSTAAFAGADRPLAGYYSWGSNDGAFERTTYRELRFLPGAIAETAVSSSGRTFRPTSRGQSLMADLIAGGLTGAKAYVSEPLTQGICPADLLFDRYVRGYTLVESFGMATPFLKWKDLVLGDPLCAPYAVR